MTFGDTVWGHAGDTLNRIKSTLILLCPLSPKNIKEKEEEGKGEYIVYKIVCWKNVWGHWGQIRKESRL